MITRYIVTSIAFLILNGINISSSACSCKYLSKTENLKERTLSYGLIFSGRVMKVEAIKRNNKKNPDLIEISFQVNKIYKKEDLALQDSTLTIYQEASNCRSRFDVLQRYLIYAFKDENGFFTNQCAPSVMVFKAKEHISVLKELGYIPKDDTLYYRREYNFVNSYEELKSLTDDSANVIDSVNWKPNSKILTLEEKQKLKVIYQSLDLKDNSSLRISYFDYNPIEYSENIGARRLDAIMRYFDLLCDKNTIISYKLYHTKITDGEELDILFKERKRRLEFHIVQ